MDDTVSEHTNTNISARRRASLKYAANNKARISERMKSYRVANPEKALWRAAKSRAQKRGIPFDIEVIDILIPKVCPVLGLELALNFKQGGGKNSPSLDRIVPELGYVKGNVQVLSSLANAMKSDASKEQLLQFADWIKNTYE